MPTLEERNKAAVRRFTEAIEGGDAELTERTFAEFVDPDVVISTPLPIDATGPAALREIFGRLRAAFPDLHVEIDDLIAEGDKVVARNTVTGTHRGDFMGLPATGRTVRYDEIFIVRLTEGRIVETWGVVDMAALMRQVGLIPG
jgi:steroid delta-isomerase-like uncharacterized protein